MASGATDPPDELARLAAIIADGGELDLDGPEVAGLTASELSSLRAMADMRRRSRGAGSRIHAEPACDPGEPDAAGYEIMHVIGEGSHGRVYRAIDRTLRRTVALKVVKDADLDLAASERFLAEARILAALDHEHILRIHSVDRCDDGLLRLSLEHIDGVTLRDRVASDGPLGADATAHIGVQLCRALARIHAANILHGDVKPTNIMITAAGRTVLLDFGIARRIADPQAAFEPLHGTPLVMAPEQFSCADGIDRRADLFAVGAVLYFATTGRYPFEGHSLDEIRERMRRGPADRVDGVGKAVPRALADIIAGLLERDPAARPASAEAVELALTALLPEARRQRVRRRLLRGLALAFTLCATGLLALLLRPGPLQLGMRLLVLRAGAVQSLIDGDFVQLGDPLTLEIDIDRPAWVYVFNEDGDGRLTVMYPERLPGAPLPAGTHRLPEPGLDGEHYWMVESEGRATEYFLCVAAEQPVAEASDLARQIEEHRELYALLDPDDPARAVGAARTLPPERAAGGDPLTVTSASTRLGQLRDRLHARPGIVARFLSLRHPAP